MMRPGRDSTRGGIRTPDARLRTAALYPLSYEGARLKRIPRALGESQPDSIERQHLVDLVDLLAKGCEERGETARRED